MITITPASYLLLVAFAAHCSDQAGAACACKVISLDWPAREAARQDEFRGQFWPDDLLRAIDVEAAAQDAGIPLQMAGVVHDFGQVIEPGRLCHHLVGTTPLIVGAKISGISRNDHDLMLMAKMDASSALIKSLWRPVLVEPYANWQLPGTVDITAIMWPNSSTVCIKRAESWSQLWWLSYPLS